jgi:putative pyrroloquinoline-quinone binding quinoprotein
MRSLPELSMVLWLSGALVPLPMEASEALIPREDNHRDAAIRRAVDLIRRGELPRGIQILQEIVEDPSARRVLREVPADFGPSRLLGAPKAMDPLDGSDRGEEGAEKEATPAPASPRGEIRVGERPEKVAQLYLPVSEVARQLLGGLPPEGVAVYRKTYDALAARRFEAAQAARSPALLARLAEDFALSSVGILARERLAEIHFEEGRFWSALQVWRSILAEPAVPEVSANEVELKCLAALRLLGENEAYQEARKAFLSHLRSQSGSDGLAGAYEQLLAWVSRFEAGHPPASSAGTSVAPGAGAVPLPGLPGPRLSLEWVSSFWSDRSGAAPQFGRILPAERTFPFFPSLSGPGAGGTLAGTGGDGEDSVVLNSVFRLHRISTLTGRVSRVYSKPLPSRDLLHFEERTDSPVYCATLASIPEDAGPSGPGGTAAGSAGTVILASYLSDRVKPQSFRGYEIYSEIPTRSLCALDAATGQVRWQTGDLSIGQAGKAVSFTTPALVVGRRVVACGWQQVGYINSIIAAFDLASGDLLWHQLLASNQLELTMFGEMGREPFAAVLAEREGVVYCVTNLGAVAAVEVDTGNIRWVTTYPAIDVEPGDGQRSPIREIVWGVNPPLFVGEALIVTPRDSEHLLAIDLGKTAGPPRARRQPGRIRFSYSNSDREMRDLLGQAGGILYFTGPGGVQALDIRDAAAGGAPRRVPTTITWTEKGVEGRGALTDAGVVVAAETPGWAQGIEGAEGAGRVGSRLCLVDLSLKRRTILTGSIPKLSAPRAGGPAQTGLDAGNVTVAGGRVFLTSRESITCFVPRDAGSEEDRPGSARDQRQKPPADGGPAGKREDL